METKNLPNYNLQNENCFLYLIFVEIINLKLTSGMAYDIIRPTVKLIRRI